MAWCRRVRRVTDADIRRWLLDHVAAASIVTAIAVFSVVLAATREWSLAVAAAAVAGLILALPLVLVRRTRRPADVVLALALGGVALVAISRVLS